MKYTRSPSLRDSLARRASRVASLRPAPVIAVPLHRCSPGPGTGSRLGGRTGTVSKTTVPGHNCRASAVRSMEEALRMEEALNVSFVRPEQCPSAYACQLLAPGGPEQPEGAELP